MSKIKRALTVSETLCLINDLIHGTVWQTKLIEWKKKHKTYNENEDDLGKVGWRNFLKRNCHLL